MNIFMTGLCLALASVATGQEYYFLEDSETPIVGYRYVMQLVWIL